MANGIAIAHITGNITRDAELNDSGKVLSFGVASNKRVKNQNDEYEDRADFFDIKVLGNRAQALEQYLKQGVPVTVFGELTQDRWEDKETGGKRSAVRVIAREVVWGSKKGEESAELRDDTKDLF